MNSKTLPTVIIIISSFASVFYLYDGDLRRGIYWMAAAILNAAVTF